MERENAEGIIANSLEAFFNDNSDDDVCLVWGNRKWESNFYANKHLNVIFPKDISPADLMGLVVEYSYSSNYWVRLTRKIYVALSISRCFRGLMASSTLSIYSNKKNFSKIVILPGNHAIRLLDFENSTSTVILKSGYSPQRIQAAVTARIQFQNILEPKILTFDFDKGWYTEKIINGVPLDRSKNIQERKKLFLLAYEVMGSIYRDTVEEVPLLKHAKYLCDKIDQELMELPSVYNNKIKGRIRKVRALLSRELAKSAISKDTIPLALSHGDFQAANILIPMDTVDESLYLIDWEYSEVRILFYDILVYHLGCRFPEGLGERICALLSSWSDIEDYLNIIPFLIKMPKMNVSIIWIFLLEELRFRISDSMTPDAKFISAGLLTFLSEVESVLDAREAQN